MTSFIHTGSQKFRSILKILSTALLVVSNLCIHLMLFGFREIYMMFEVIGEPNAFMLPLVVLVNYHGYGAF